MGDENAGAQRTARAVAEAAERKAFENFRRLADLEERVVVELRQAKRVINSLTERLEQIENEPRDVINLLDDPKPDSEADDFRDSLKGGEADGLAGRNNGLDLPLADVDEPRSECTGCVIHVPTWDHRFKVRADCPLHKDFDHGTTPGPEEAK
jgi:hypothetical protein